jgi:outer membrane protein OmpA-like peptidoglycan-associated protein
MTKLILIIILTNLSFFSFGQQNNKKIASSFYQFDSITNTDFASQEIQTDKIKFSNNGELDSVASKTTLDSIVWFLGRHPKVIISLTLLKVDASLGENKNRKLSQIQTNEIAEYLSKKGVDQLRILRLVSYVRASSLTIENTKKTRSKSTKNIVTRIFVLSDDFKIPNSE